MSKFSTQKLCYSTPPQYTSAQYLTYGYAAGELAGGVVTQLLEVLELLEDVVEGRPLLGVVHPALVHQ